MSDLLVSVRNLLAKAKEFDSLNSREQAAFRASLTRLLNQAQDDKIKGALLKVRGLIGESAKSKSYDKVTVEEVEKEFESDFGSYDTKKRGAFKAKVTRMLKAADEAGESDDKKRLATLQFSVYELENREVKNEIFDLLDDLLSSGENDDDLDAVAEIS